MWILQPILGGGFKYFLFRPYLRKISNLTNIFQKGWNHQLVHWTHLNMFWTRQAMFVLPPQLQHGKAWDKVEQKTRVDGLFSVCVFHPALTRRSPLCIALKTGRCFSKPGKLHAGQREEWKHRFAWAFPLEHWLQRISCERCSWMWLSMAACVFLLECLIFCSTKNKLSRFFFRILGVGKKYVFLLAFVFCQVKQ